MSEDHGSAATRYPTENPLFLSVKPGMTVVVTEVDTGTIRWVNADLVTHIVAAV